ncbi:LLM class flavin-dependent oxidoreductase [Microbacterium sp. MPKO10]|uniref:LLM class flavin-dependent oxidoreductase n=1 Tax=Microbacterium sp. MPKO10 TaxID=2989818 RepID=UPI0022360003|nr:LLM class flavin-dependent oxidoreductase [Microbacterium sp. MPKO10]MCW4459186.1 LLM class flavin-dependent oxidoreductase [Microbacterium sp. MPKO10]
MSDIQFGLDTFGDVTIDDAGERTPGHQVIRDVVTQAIIADQAGIDAIGLGEHHRDDYAISSPDMVLAAIAGQTSRIRLGTAVTVLSSDDPVRVYERFATLDAVSSGRAEITLGRGSFTESFPLFGFDLDQYEMLFTEKLDMFSKLLTEKPVSWQGSHRPPLFGANVYPKTAAGRIPTWIGVGGSPESVIRSVRYEIPMMLAIIGGDPARFAPYVDLYHRAADELQIERMPLGAHSPGHIAATDELAREQLFPHFKTNRDRIGAERGWPPTTRADFDNEADNGSLYVGSPETVARRIASTITTLGLDRFDLKYSNGPMPHSELTASIELYGSRVIPMVKDILGR